MTELRYPARVVIADVARGAIGLSVCVTAAVLAASSPWLLGLTVAVAALFAAFALRALSRTRQRYTLDAEAIRVTATGARMLFSNMSNLKLSYFSTRRDHRNGWLELVLRFNDASLRVDSRLQGFDVLLERALAAALGNRVSLDAATQRNLEWLGMTPDAPSADESQPQRGRHSQWPSDEKAQRDA